MTSARNRRNAVLCAIVLLIVILGNVWTWWAYSDSRKPCVEVVAVSPPRASEGPVEADAYSNVEFVYQIRNCGTAPLCGVRAEGACQCSLTRVLPERIESGQVGIIGIKTRAPAAGTAGRKMEVYCDSASMPLAVLEPQIRVRKPVPSFYQRLEDISLTFVEGEGSISRETVFSTIEKRDTAPWLENLEVAPPGVLAVSLSNVVNQPLDDVNLTKRSYIFKIDNSFMPVGRHHGQYRFKPRSGGPAVEESHQLEVIVLERVSCVPSALTIPSVEGATARVSLVDRVLGRPDVSTVRFDESALQVRSLLDESSASPTFEVRLLNPCSGRNPTTVSFEVTGYRTVVLPVYFASRQKDQKK